MIEQWKQVPGYEGYYEASNFGRIRSVDRMVKTRSGQRRCKGGMRAPGRNPQNGYLYIGLSKEGKNEMKPLHHWISLAWIGPCPPGEEVRHGEEGKSNNSASNLCYGTRVQNHADKRRDGTSGDLPVRRGDGAVFTSMTEAAQETGCPLSSVSQACNGKLKHAGGYTWEKL